MFMQLKNAKATCSSDFWVFITLSFSNYTLAVSIMYYFAVSPGHLNLVDSQTAIIP